MVQGRQELGLAKENNAKNCIKYGKYERTCPQNLSMRQYLERVYADLDRKEFFFNEIRRAY